jgi:imidazolonepropionase-like amidohydrolase
MNRKERKEHRECTKCAGLSAFSAFFAVKSLRLAAAAGALLLGSAAPAGAETLLLSGATVHTISGETLSPGQVLVQDGKITAVGKSLPAANARQLDLSGQQLYPGMIALNTLVGLSEIEGVRATQDTTEVGDFTPDVESWIAVNPDSELIPVSRADGIAYFEPVPQGGIVAGQSALMAIDGWTTEQMAIKKPLALHLFWPSMTLDTTPREPKAKGKSLDEQAKERRTKLQGLVDFFDEAKAYAKAKAAAQHGAPAPEVVPAWEAMLPYVSGQLPIVVHADEIRQIRAALRWAETNAYKIVLAGGRDAWMAADQLGARKIPVIYAHIYTLPRRDSASYDVQFTAPEVLHKAGVPVTFTISPGSFNAPLTKNLPYEAAQAVAFGLPEAEALKGLTLYPAQIAGVADRLGSIEVGKEATLLALDGSLLDIRAHVKHLWVAGKEVSLENRHSKLYEKYKHRPKAK